LLSSWSTGNGDNIRHFAEIHERLYLIADVFFSGDRKSSIYLFDSLASQAELIYSDTILRLQFISNDSASIYYSSQSGDSYQFNITNLTLNLLQATQARPNDKLKYVDGYLLSVDTLSISKIDTTSNQKLWQTNLQFQINDIISQDGFIYACGFDGYYGNIMSGSPGSLHAFAAKLDSKGNILWQNSYGNNGENVTDNFQRIVFDSSGNLLCIGSTGPWYGFNYFFLVCIDRNGIEKKESIISNNPGRESNMQIINIERIEKIETNIIHLIFVGQINHMRYYYAQVSY
jgi:hypothetical protein